MELQMASKGDSGMQVSDKIFGRDFNEGLVHQAVVAYLAGGRAGTRAQKNRSDVRGGGAKPWAQKGTGRARAGTSRSPIWRSGGVTFAARPQDHSQKLNKKMYKTAMQSILSELVRQDRLVVVKEFSVTSPKTKEMLTKLNELGLVSDPKSAGSRDRLLVVSEDADVNLFLSARNLPYVNVEDVAGVNPVNLIGSEKVLMTEASVKALEEKLS